MVLGLAMLEPHRLCRGPMVPCGATIRPLAPLSRYRPQRYFGNQGLAAQQACVQAMVVDQAAGDFQIDGAVPPLLRRAPGLGFLLARPDGTPSYAIDDIRVGDVQPAGA